MKDEDQERGKDGDKEMVIISSKVKDTLKRIKKKKKKHLNMKKKHEDGYL